MRRHFLFEDVNSGTNAVPEERHIPKISVLIPAHNATSTLRRTIASIRTQTIPVDEVILGDDGSTDGTAELARELGCHVVTIPKATGAAARNAAFAASSGEIVFLLDADDEWLPRKVEAHVAAHALTRAPVVIDPSRRVRANGSVRGLNGAGPEEFLGWQDFVQQQNWSSGSGISAKRDCWTAVRGFQDTLRALQDVDFLLRATYFCGPAFRLPESYTLYHLSESGISRGRFWGEEVIQDLVRSCDFLDADQIENVRFTVALRNALLADPRSYWSIMRPHGYGIRDYRTWKNFLLSLRQAMRRH